MYDIETNKQIPIYTYTLISAYTEYICYWMYQYLDSINILRVAAYAKINYFHPIQISAQRYHDT